MNRSIILILVIVAVLVVSGCTQISQNTEDSIDDDTITCNKPYITVGEGCCLDGNDNQICDNVEETAPLTVEGYYSPTPDNHGLLDVPTMGTSGQEEATFIIVNGFDGFQKGYQTPELDFHIVAGEERIENLDIYATCVGVLKQNSRGVYTTDSAELISFRTERMSSPFKLYSTNASDGSELRIFSTDYFINNEKVFITDDSSSVTLMTPGGSVNYRMWFNAGWFFPVTVITEEDYVYEPGKYMINCDFDIVSQSPSYEVNKNVNIYFVVRE